MIMNTTMYYQAEAKAPLTGILLFFAITLVVGLIGGVVYGLAIWHIPIVYARIALPFAYGFLLGYCFNWGIRLGKIRGFKHQSKLGFVGAIIALYLAWAIWETIVLESGNFFYLISLSRWSSTKTG